MKGRIKEDDSSVPSPDGALRLLHALPGGRPASDPLPRAARRRRRADAARRRRACGRQGLLPARRNARTRPTTSCSRGRPTIRARNIDTLRVRDLSTGARPAPTRSPTSTGSPVWTADSTAFYYVRLDANHRPSRVYRHRLGTPAADDVLVYEETGQPVLRLARRVAVRPLRARSRCTITRPRRCWLLDLTDRRRDAALVAARETVGAVRCRASPELVRRRVAC